jgi:hypothetical protein
MTTSNTTTPCLLALALTTAACGHDYREERRGLVLDGPAEIGGPGRSGPGEDTTGEDPADLPLLAVDDASYEGKLRADRDVDVIDGPVYYRNEPGLTQIVISDAPSRARSMLIVNAAADLTDAAAARSLQTLWITACSGDGNGYDWEHSIPVDTDLEEEPLDDPDDPVRLRYAFSGTFPDGVSYVDASFSIEIR